MKKIFLLIISLVFCISCGKSDNPFEKIKDNYINTFLILNEGNVENSSFNIYAINKNFTDIKKNIYTNSESTNSIAKSISFINDKAFIVISNLNKIEVVNRYTFDHIATITEELQGPSYITFSSGNAYVTNSGNNSVAVFDIDSYQFIENIDIKGVAEYIVSDNNKVYVQKKGNATNIDNEIVVIDAETNAITSTIKIQDVIQGMVSNSGFVYVLSSIDTRTNYYKINTLDNQVLYSYTSTKVADGKKLVIDKNILYYVSGNNIHTWKPTASSVDTTPLFTIEKEKEQEKLLLNGFNVINGNVFTADALDFTAKSRIVIYDLNGVEITSFRAGIGTNNFYAN